VSQTSVGEGGGGGATTYANNNKQGRTPETSRLDYTPKKYGARGARGDEMDVVKGHVSHVVAPRAPRVHRPQSWRVVKAFADVDLQSSQACVCTQESERNVKKDLGRRTKTKRGLGGVVAVAVVEVVVVVVVVVCGGGGVTCSPGESASDNVMSVRETADPQIATSARFPCSKIVASRPSAPAAPAIITRLPAVGTHIAAAIVAHGCDCG
jgi:hypothetical protein